MTSALLARTGTASDSALRYRAAMAEREDNRWVTLVLVCLAQFMVILDATIVNIALPTIQEDLDFSQADLQWVVNCYTLLFGGFLLLGGRAADILGRKRIFIAGTILFSVASLLNGLAPERRAADRLPRPAGPRRRARLPRRAVHHHHDLPRRPGTHQGVGRLERDRGRRRRGRPAARRHPHRDAELGVDLLRQRADRRRAAILSARLITESKAERAGSFDVLGAVLVTAGLMVLVYAIVKAESFGWGSAERSGWPRSASRCSRSSSSSSPASRARWSA